MSSGAVSWTSAQLAAIDVSRRHVDACVVAGPGSGKTTVLVEYFQRLVEAGVDPLRILAITFTEKAAGNMRAKLARTFDERPAIRAALERAWVSTVHGFCARLLRENAVFAGVDPEFQVSDERESWRMQQESMAAAMESLFAERPEDVRALIRGLSSIEFEEAVLSAYDAMRGAGVRVEELAGFAAPDGVTVRDVARTVADLRKAPLTLWNESQREQLEAAIEGAERIVSAASARGALEGIAAFACNLQKCKRGNAAYELVKKLKSEVDKARYALITEHYAPQRALLIEILRRFDRLYRERKRQAGMLDFSDLEEFTVRLLEESPETRARLQEQFEHVLMDEFQDTNGQQARLLGLIRPPGRFYAVGDINQSIFGFRHAEPQGFADYRGEVEASGGRLVELVDNFRSRAAILSAVETVVNAREGIVPRSLVAGREFDDERPVCVEAICVAPGEDEEAQWVARRTLEILRAEPQFTFQDVAVLVRNTEVLGAFTAAFDAAAIPYVVNRGRGFYDTREVNDLTQLLRVIANPRDETALAAVLRSPLAGASDEELLGLRMAGHNLGEAFLASELLPPELGRFRDRLRDWRKQRERVTFDRLLLAAIDECGYRPESGARGDANIDKFLAQARAAASRMSLDEFVEELALVRESNPREPDAPPEDSANAVKLMTVHSAKGLEFPIVFVAAMHKGIETNPPVVAFSRQYGLGARWRMPGAREDKDDLFQHAIRAERKQRETEESHRLLYVAMTRAEEHLCLSFSGERAGNWAKVAIESLGLADLERARDEVVAQRAPDGKEWALRVLVADAGTDAGPRIESATEAAVVELVERPAIAEQYDSGATVTSLGTFAVCPRKFWLQAQGREQAPRGNGASKEIGTEVHELLAGTLAEGSAEATRLAEVFRRSALGKRSAAASRVEREFDFVMAVEDVVVRGQVDLWFEEVGGLTIVDYKTDAVSGPEAHQRAGDYALQVRLYAMAVERIAGRAPDRAWLHFLRPDKAVQVDLTPSLLESPEQVVRDFRAAQESGEFPMNPGRQCERCGFYKKECAGG
jgi:ATP-dependent exoDNAse (exonuclease V) beta subunit